MYKKIIKAAIISCVSIMIFGCNSGNPANSNNTNFQPPNTVNSLSSLHLMAVTYGDGLFVAADLDGEILTSNDGDNWSLESNLAPNRLYNVSYDDGQFIAAGNDGNISISKNGLMWDHLHVEVNGIFPGIVYGNNNYVITGGEKDDAIVLTSDNGLKWVSNYIKEGPFSFLAKATYGNGKFIAVGRVGPVGDTKGLIMVSHTGVEWRRVIPSTSVGSLTGIAYDGHDKFVAVGEKTLISTHDGLTWNAKSVTGLGDLQNICYGNGKFVAVGLLGRIFISSDGDNWQSVFIGALDNIKGITYGNGMYIAVTMNGSIWKSTDAISWKPVYPIVK